MSKNPFLFNTHDLPRRPGEMREYELTFDEHEALGFEVLAIAADEPIDIDLRIESVAEGILATATVRTEASGECGRCLDAVYYDVNESFQELYEYVEDPRQARKKNKPGKKRVNKTEEEDFSMYADVEAAASTDKSKIYCSQKILGLSPSKLISIGFDFVGANAIDTDTIGSYFGNTADFNNNSGIRFAANFPVISNNKVIY